MKIFRNVIATCIIIFINILFYKNSNAQMFWNQACQFTSSPISYIAVPNSTTLNITSSFTLEAWVFPTSVAAPEKGIISKGSTLGASLRYALKISTTGRVTLSTNGILRLTSTISLTANTWTHVCGTYNSATNTFSLYLNGTLNTSAVVAGAVPSSNTDSLYIGVAGAALPYSGFLDEVRIWNRDLSSTEIGQYFRTSLGTSTGVYSGLSLSFTFQNRNSGGSVFTLNDWSNTGNNGFNRNVTALSQSNKPYNTIFPNECVTLDGAGDYLIGPSNSLVSPSSQISLEAWIYPRDFTASPVIISKNSSTSYKLGLSTLGKVQFSKGGGTLFEGKTSLSTGRWTHIAATYDLEVTAIYVNGILDTIGFPFFGPIGTNTDSLTIGCDNIGGTTSNFFNGYIDEARIANYAKSNTLIKSYLYRSIDSINQPNLALTNVCYNLDGYTFDNADGGPRLIFKNDARFNHPGTISNQPITPMDRADALSFSDGFNIKQSGKRIPLSTGIGTLTDTIVIPFNVTVNDINLFIGLNHFDEGNLDFYLIGPNGDSLDFSTDNLMIGANDNVVTIFDDQADSSVTTVRYTSFAPKIRPEKNFSTLFNGDFSQGNWILRITDDGGNADTGRVYAWGLQFNNSPFANRVTNLNLTSIIEGFWNGAVMVADTARIYLRNTSAPYTITDSGKILLNSNGNGILSFINTGTASKYITFKHRNSVETWSANPVSFIIDLTTSYDFTTAANKAFGNNEILKLGKFCIYSGDVNQDGSIDLADVSLIDNAANAFTVGYVSTDVNGDNFVDIDDLTIADNNAFNFVGIIRP
ncbi:MAG: LamG-like jellyroll fold domain-containing protein [bacterium]